MQNPQPYDPYRLPPELQASFEQRYKEAESRKRRQIGATYASKNKALMAEAAKHGFLGSGEQGRQAFTTAMQQAQEETQAMRELESARSAEELGLARTERGYQAELQRMGAGYGYQSQLLGQQQFGTMQIEQMRNQLQRDLQEGKITHEAYQAEQERLNKMELQSGQLGWESEKWGGQMQLTQAQQQIEREKQQLDRDLQEGRISHEAHQAEQERLNKLAMQEGQLGWEREQMYGPGYGPAAGITAGGGPGAILGGEGTYGGTYGLELQKLALQREAMGQQQQQFQTQHGYFDAQGNWVPGSSYEESSMLAGEQFGYSAGIEQIKGDIAQSMETLKFDQSMQAKIMQGVYDIMNAWLAGTIQGPNMDNVQDFINEFWNPAWGDAPNVTAMYSEGTETTSGNAGEGPWNK